ncbi:hypothetical protein RIF29_26129 [Crotalaria pallida]|uniref:Uncharacterized protein n=1 Tax=Crotalaria pallida TaxID=3830 RepID=A0AAN9EN03_CROPI
MLLSFGLSSMQNGSIRIPFSLSPMPSLTSTATTQSHHSLPPPPDKPFRFENPSRRERQKLGPLRSLRTAADNAIDLVNQSGSSCGRFGQSKKRGISLIEINENKDNQLFDEFTEKSVQDICSGIHNLKCSNCDDVVQSVRRNSFRLSSGILTQTKKRFISLNEFQHNNDIQFFSEYTEKNVLDICNGMQNLNYSNCDDVVPCVGMNPSRLSSGILSQSKKRCISLNEFKHNNDIQLFSEYGVHCILCSKMANANIVNLPVLYHHPVVNDNSMRFKLVIPGWDGVVYPHLTEENDDEFMENLTDNEEEGQQTDANVQGGGQLGGDKGQSSGFGGETNGAA